MAKRKNRKKDEELIEETPQGEVDEILDDLLGEPEPDPDEAEEGESPTDESVPPSAEGEAEGELAAEGKASDAGEQPPSAEPTEEAPNTEVKVEENEATKREQGLQAEIANLRKKMREMEAQRNLEAAQAQAPAVPPQVPAPPPPGHTTAPPVGGPPQVGQPGATPNTELPQIPVMMSPDGSQVYVDPEAVQKLIDDRANSILNEALQPRPEDVSRQQAIAAAEQFASANEANREVVARANQAEEFIALNLKTLLAQGYQFQNAQQMVDTMEALGVDKNVVQHFPELEGTFGEFVESMTNPQPLVRTLMYRELARRTAPAAPAAPTPPPQGNPPNTPNPTLPPPPAAASPPSMAKAGGDRTPGNSPNMQEFQELDQRFQADGFSLSNEEFARLKQLGKQLDIEGYVDMS